MRNLLLATCLFTLSVPAMASCDDLKAQIDAKLQAKGVKSYTLDIVPVAQAAAALVTASAPPPMKPQAMWSAHARATPSRSFTNATDAP
jgi:hypothetical protein